MPSASLTYEAHVSYTVLTSLLGSNPTNSQARVGERPQLTSHKGISHGQLTPEGWAMKGREVRAGPTENESLCETAIELSLS